MNKLKEPIFVNLLKYMTRLNKSRVLLTLTKVPHAPTLHQSDLIHHDSNIAQQLTTASKNLVYSTSYSLNNHSV